MAGEPSPADMPASDLAFDRSLYFRGHRPLFNPPQEYPMTSPTQKRHDELVALLTDIRDALTRDHLHRLLAEESAAERRDETVDVTEEPPIGSQVTDKSDDVWERFADGWKLIAYRGRRRDAPSPFGVPWSEVRDYAPLRLTTDADRERVGLPVDTAPDVDPDEALAKAESEARHWRQCYGAAEYQIEQAEADVERLTRERDEWLKVAKEAGSRANSEATHRAAADARYEALRADVEVYRDGIGDRGSPSIFSSVPWAAVKIRLETILDRDDERAK